MNVDKLASKLKWGLGVLAVLVAGAVAWLYVVSLAMVGVAVVATIVGVNALPWASQKIAHFFIDLRKQDARDNPITNRQRIGLEMRAKLADRRQAIDAMNAEVNVFAGEIENLPPDERSSFTKDLESAQATVKRQVGAWVEAEKACEDFDAKTASAARKWKVAQIGQRVKALSNQGKEDEMNKLLAAESLDSVEQAMHSAFSDLDSMIEKSRLQLNPSAVIDVTAVQIKEGVAR